MDSFVEDLLAKVQEIGKNYPDGFEIPSFIEVQNNKGKVVKLMSAVQTKRCKLVSCNEEFQTDDSRKEYCNRDCQHKAMVARSNARARERSVALDKETQTMIEETGLDKVTFVRKAVKVLHKAWKDGKVKL